MPGYTNFADDEARRVARAVSTTADGTSSCGLGLPRGMSRTPSTSTPC